MTALIDRERNAALLSWYDEQRRDLPWRDVDDPYLVLVSEVMLQQTQASRVVPYYEGFIDQFPTVEILAAASLAEMLAAWSGLGYNGRARRLRDAAGIIVDDGWPQTTDDLQRLPGIGPYTAAAIASFAYGDHVVTIDTNVRRVISRWNGEPLEGAGLRAATETALGAPAADWNQAVMDLGASVCVARGARCGECPVVDWCAGPESYVPTMPQARFEGSTRQLRGAIVRAVVAAPCSAVDLVHYTGIALVEVELAVDDLIEEGLLTEDTAGHFSIAD
jgi:A/G-specific adenine glycosylase